MKARIYHNQKCSKSRAALALLRDHAIEVDVVDYLASPLSLEQLRAIAVKLSGPVIALVRIDEPEFQSYSGAACTDAEIFDLLATRPQLLQRPIVEFGDRARIGRPPERVLELFSDAATTLAA